MQGQRGGLVSVLGGSFRVGIVAASLCALAVATAAPASAYLRDGVTLDTGLVTNALDRKTVQSSCPAGKTALSAGAVLRPQQGSAIPTGLALQGLYPGGAITADEADAEGGSWTLAGQTYCALVTATPPTSATGGPYVKNVRLVNRWSGYSITSRKEAAVDCPPAAAVPIGGGFFFDGNRNRSAHLAAGSSSRMGGRFAAEVHRTDVLPPPVEWVLSVTAICADVSSPGAGYVTDLSPHSATSPVNSNSYNDARAECPPGKILVGGGAFVEGSTRGANPPFSVVLRSSIPAAPAGRPQSWFASGFKEDPESGSWRVVAKAICARVVS